MSAIAYVTMAALTLPSAAAAQDLYILETTERSITAADRNKIEWKDGRPSILLHTIWRTPQVEEVGLHYGWVQRIETEIEIDCPRRQVRTVKMTSIGFDDSEVSAVSEAGTWIDSDDGGYSHAINMACLGQTPPDTEAIQNLYGLIVSYYWLFNNPGAALDSSNE